MFYFISDISSTMFVFVTNHITVYQSKLVSLQFCFVLEFNICHRIGWIYPRLVCCSKCSFLCSALRIIVSFFSLGHCMYSICFTMIDFPFDISKLLHIALSVLWFTAFASFWYLLITPSIFLISPCVPSDRPFDVFQLPLCFVLITPLVSLDHSVCIFWLSLWYLLITILVSSNYHLWYLLISSLFSSD
jgi:hypothetical protein